MPQARSRSYVGKHRRPARRTAARVTVVTTVGTLLAAGSLIGTAEAATANDFYRLRMCESTNNYGINTGNGYYGAYQFDLQTWHGLGYGGRPDQASPSTQDAAARRLQADRGWAPWPACSRKLGLRGGASTASRAATRVILASYHANTGFAPAPAPAFSGQPLRTTLIGSERRDVRSWQQRMRQRGWTITVDGRFGSQSAAVARSFQRQLHADGHGVVGPKTWRQTWEAPVTG